MTADITEWHEGAQALAMYWDLVKNHGMTLKEYRDIKKLVTAKLLGTKTTKEDEEGALA